MQFVIATLHAISNFWSGMRAFAWVKGLFRATMPESNGVPIVLVRRDADHDLPIGLPSPSELRVLAQYLREECPTDDALGLARTKRYEVIHELAGYHDAVDRILGVADTLDDLERSAADPGP